GSAGILNRQGLESPGRRELQFVVSVSRRREVRGDARRQGAALGVSPAARADARLLPHLRNEIVHNVVRTGGVAADPGGHVIQLQVGPGAPCDVVVSAGAVAADAERSDQYMRGVVDREPT